MSPSLLALCSLKQVFALSYSHRPTFPGVDRRTGDFGPAMSRNSIRSPAYGGGCSECGQHTTTNRIMGRAGTLYPCRPLVVANQAVFSLIRLRGSLFWNSRSCCQSGPDTQRYRGSKVVLPSCLVGVGCSLRSMDSTRCAPQFGRILLELGCGTPPGEPHPTAGSRSWAVGSWAGIPQTIPSGVQ